MATSEPNILHIGLFGTRRATHACKGEMRKLHNGGSTRAGFGLTLGGRYVPFPAWLATLVRFGLLLPLARLSRGKTFGAQIAVFDPQDRVLLVRQGYTPHWVFPGGGVDRGESAEAAVRRELREEAGIDGVAPRFFGLYTNFGALPDDHVAFFVGKHAGTADFPGAGFEIVAHGFFSPDGLPDNAAPSVRRRLAEIAAGRQTDSAW